jgi:hypothetical protein
MVQGVCAPVPKVGGYIGLKGHFCVGCVGFAGCITLFIILKKKKKKKKIKNIPGKPYTPNKKLN